MHCRFGLRCSPRAVAHPLGKCDDREVATVAKILRYADEHGTVRVGLRDDAGDVRPLPGVPSMAALLRLPLAELRERVARGTAAEAAPAAITVLPPVDGDTEVWASGVTYERSREARVEESASRAIYDRVYDAPRPELFFKSQPWRVVTGSEPIAVRADSSLNVPEPELALVVNAYGEVVAYGVCNDVSSRSIEGENALYLPQAKIYAGSCALAAELTPVWDVDDVRAARIDMHIERAGTRVFSGTVALSSMRRAPGELAEYLFRGQPFPDGAVIATGTGIVPDMDFTLEGGDTVDIAITGIGRLRNPVVTGSAGLDWLVEARGNPASRWQG